MIAELFSNLGMGLAVAFTPTNLMFLLIGALVGMIVGLFPGFGPAAGIAILLPLTFGLEPTTAIIMLAGIYYGAMYGGTITSILINTPGESATVASTLDGYPLAQNGRAGPALVMQAVASFVGGTSGVLLISALIPTLATFAASFGPSEYFLIILFGLIMLTAVMGDNKLKGAISALIGFAISMVGVDVISGSQRFTFGSSELIGGIYFVPVAIGLFGIGELLYCVYIGQHRQQVKKMRLSYRSKEFWPSRDDFSRSRFTFVRGSLIGFVSGLLPGSGGTLGSIVGYSVEKRVAKDSENFGKGDMRGLVAPECANNAASAGSMVPLLSLGIPGSGATAVLLGAFMMWGLRPGPMMIVNDPEFVWGLIASMYLGNMILIALCVVAIPLFVKFLDIPYRLVIPVIVVLCVIGTYALHSSIIETWMLIAGGLLGLGMKLYGYSPAATVLALVLGSMAENTLLQSLITSDGSLMIFVERPVSLVLTCLVLCVAMGPWLARWLRRSAARIA
ncbi:MULTISPECIES: tripartite tricarboxylate transporter permease [Halomonas]|uniref:tripartite tricarboxylate transporter permease n=1 Tax=Halomonas TaxID=2745 RepID=UPI001C962F18|nr:MULTISPECIES: tripartite tricarboxylate transporter permease [Halomonas]MBY5924421.1 tripartite tricarboxylate transporter permease [Halomonas sp. DP4Y7-2]MBY5968382.1 tripartite tricarboxylate transporter permease [Halomonas denitrificans]MBY6231463.1 tripartite tricarboxylate transporter permease [Halomonas sp. DP4Y7-1]